MSLTAKQGPPLEQIEEGNHHGISVAVIDLGTQYSEKFKKEQPKVMITWELPDFPMTDEGQNKSFRLISKEYTASLGEKAILYIDLVSWRGRSFTPEELEGFNIKNVLGANCLINVVKNDKGYSNVATVAKLPKGMKSKTPTYQLLYDMDEGIEAIPEGVPDWIKDKIKKSREYMSLGDSQTNGSQTDKPPATVDDIPF